MSHPSGIRVIIAGAGICGLATAIALRKKGFHVQVFESAKGVSEIGAGIQLPSNCTRLFEKWGLLDAIKEVADDTFHTELKRYADGETLMVMADDKDLYGFPKLTIHRADYQELLYKAALDLGAEVTFGKRVETTDTSIPSVTFTDGTTVNGDLLIAADGIRSRVRSVMLEEQGATSNPVVCNEICYRMLIPGDKVKAVPELVSLMEPPAMRIWPGPDSFAICYPIRHGEQLNVLLTRLGSAKPGVWNEPGDVEELRSHFEGYEPTIHKILDLVDNCLKWAIAEVPPLDTWSSASGRVTIVGDAAHGMHPHLGQGAAMAVEDSAVLVECLARAQSPADLPSLLKMYEQVRKARCQRIQEVAKQNGERSMIPDGPAQKARDAMYGELMGKMKMMKMKGAGPPVRPPPVMMAPAPSPPFNSWLYGLDAFEEANNHLDAHWAPKAVNGTSNTNGTSNGNGTGH